METLLIYLLKVNVALTVFYLLYVTLLKKDTFIKMRRYFFLSAMVFSLLYPAITVEALRNLSDFWANLVPTTAAVTVEQPTMIVLADNQQTASQFISLQQVAIWLALASTLFFLVRFLWQVFSIMRIRLRSEKQTVMGVSVFHLPDETTPFSFFRWIFVNTESHSREELTQILLHEQTHARQWHSVDIMLAELLCVFFWWNPFVWLMKREIAINLEYLADSGVLRTGVNSREYQYHLLRLTYHETAVQIVNNFNVSQLKQRIMMMNKSKSPTTKLAKYLTILPLALLLVTINSCANKEKKSDENSEAAEEVTTPATDSVAQTTEPATVYTGEIFSVVENQPEFIGGTATMMKFLQDNIKYPAKAQEDGIQGRVIANFVVEKDGKISDVQVVRSVDPLLDKEAVRIIQSMPNWKPGTQKGEPVRVRFTLPVIFRLQGKETGKSGTPPPPPPPPPAYSKSSEELKNTNEVFVVVEKQPEFPNGTSAMMKFLNDNIKYPMEAQEKSIQGRVIVNFVVEKDGSLSDFNISRSVDPLLDTEAVRVIQAMPKWKPGTQRGQTVRVRYTLPVTFKLQQ